ncbi:MAG: YggT family protein [Pseudomonadota bacterium]
MIALFVVLDAILGFYWWIIIASAIFSWLYAFNVVNSSNQFVGMIGNFLYQLTEPALRPIRRIMPNLGTIDLSPIVLLFGIMFLRIFLRTSIAPAFGVVY